MSTNERDESIVQIATDRFERRLAEENGKLRVEMAAGFGQLRAALAGLRGELRAEMIERNHELLKWALVLWVGLIAALATMFALFL